MQLLRLAESTELNNACIVGFAVLCALVVTWLLVALSISLIRQAGQVLRIRALHAFTDGYSRKARLVGVIASFAIAICGAAAVGYALWRHIDLQPVVDKLLAQVTDDALLTVARSADLVIVFLVAFYLLRVGSRARARADPRAAQPARAR